MNENANRKDRMTDRHRQPYVQLNDCAQIVFQFLHCAPHPRYSQSCHAPTVAAQVEDLQLR